MRIILAGFLCISCCSLFSQTGIAPGAPAPEIHITDWIHNVPDDKELDDKYIVLEFWATWCGPCIKAVPHMNQLQANISRDDLYFISMTDESVEKVKRTLSRVDFHSIVVSDQTEKTQTAFSDGERYLPSLPMTVLIDERGILQWIGHPDLLTKQVLSDFLSGSLSPVNHLSKSKDEREKNKSEQSENLGDGKEGVRTYIQLYKDEDVLYYFEFNRSNSPYKSMNRIRDQVIKLKGYTLPEIYGELFGLNPRQVVVPDSLLNSKFELIYKNVRSNESTFRRLELEILNVLSLKKTHESIQTKVWKVSIRDSSMLEKTLNTNISTQSMAGDKLILKNTDMAGMLDVLNDISEAHFTWNGSDDVHYDFMINTASFEKIKNDLESYGLKLTEGQKTIEKTLLEFQ